MPRGKLRTRWPFQQRPQSLAKPVPHDLYLQFRQAGVRQDAGQRPERGRDLLSTQSLWDQKGQSRASHTAAIHQPQSYEISSDASGHFIHSPSIQTAVALHACCCPKIFFPSTCNTDFCAFACNFGLFPPRENVGAHLAAHHHRTPHVPHGKRVTFSSCGSTGTSALDTICQVYHAPLTGLRLF